MTFHDCAADGQPKPKPLRLGRKEGIEQVGLATTFWLLDRLAKMNWRFCIAILRRFIGLEALPGTDVRVRLVWCCAAI